jgi:hypothetical protein
MAEIQMVYWWAVFRLPRAAGQQRRRVHRAGVVAGAAIVIAAAIIIATILMAGQGEGQPNHPAVTGAGRDGAGPAPLPAAARPAATAGSPRWRRRSPSRWRSR